MIRPEKKSQQGSLLLDDEWLRQSGGQPDRGLAPSALDEILLLRKRGVQRGDPSATSPRTLSVTILHPAPERNSRSFPQAPRSGLSSGDPTMAGGSEYMPNSSRPVGGEFSRLASLCCCLSRVVAKSFRQLESPRKSFWQRIGHSDPGVKALR
jgi:hypothetical protein